MGCVSCSHEGERQSGAAKRLHIRMGHPCGSAGGRGSRPVHAAAYAAWLCSSAAGLWRRRQQQQQGYQLFGTLSAVSWWEAVAWCGHVSEKGFGDLTMRVCCGCVAHCVYGVCACVVPPLSGFAAMQARSSSLHRSWPRRCPCGCPGSRTYAPGCVCVYCTCLLPCVSASHCVCSQVRTLCGGYQ